MTSMMMYDWQDQVRYGIVEAVFLQRLRFWIGLNKSKGENYRDGRTWSYSSYKSISAAIHFTPEQVRRAVKKLVNAGILITGNFNRLGYDQTCWYAFADASVETSTGGWQKTQMEVAPGPNGSGSTTKPIPVIKQDGEQIGKPLQRASAHAVAAGSSQAQILNPDSNSISGSNLSQGSNSNPDSISTLDSNFNPDLDSGSESGSEVSPPIKLKKEGGEVSEDTKNRLSAFEAMRKSGSGRAKMDADAPRSDLARRQAREDRAGKPPRSRGPNAPSAARAPLNVPVFAAWRDAMNRRGIPTVQIPERRDAEDAERIVQKAGTVEAAIAYVVWTVDNWDKLERKYPKLGDYGNTFGTISGMWMRSLFPESLKLAKPVTSSGESVQMTTGSKAFCDYMALPIEEKAALDPRTQKSGCRGDELIAALSAWMAAKRTLRARTG